MTSLRYKCARCEAVCGGPILRAPAMKMMHQMIEQNVCRTCLDKHMAVLDSEFWPKDKDFPTHQCRRCGAGLRGNDAYIVQHRPGNDGVWTLTQVCEPCFQLFAGCCDKTRKGGHQ